jgi:hypothetical protein
MKGLLGRLRREPVAFYGGLVSAVLVVLGFLGVSGDLIALIGTVASLVGIPITRAQVTPVTKPPAGDAGEASSFGLLAMIVVITVGVFLGETFYHWIIITHR